MLWKDCERMRGRAGEAMSALKVSPLEHSGESCTPVLWLLLAALKSGSEEECVRDMLWLCRFGWEADIELTPLWNPG